MDCNIYKLSIKKGTEKCQYPQFFCLIIYILSRYSSASRAAIHPVPADVTACL